MCTLQVSGVLYRIRMSPCCQAERAGIHNNCRLSDIADLYWWHDKGHQILLLCYLGVMTSSSRVPGGIDLSVCEHGVKHLCSAKLRSNGHQVHNFTALTALDKGAPAGA